MSKEILLVVDAVSNEKGVAKSVIFEALEAALAMATVKRHNDEIQARVLLIAIPVSMRPSVAGRCWTTIWNLSQRIIKS